MKTVMINGVKQSVSYKTNTEMLTRLTNKRNGVTSQFGADIYTAEDNKHIVLVATNRSGCEIRNTVTIIDMQKWESLTDQYDPYKNYIFHNAVMQLLGFEL